MIGYLKMYNLLATLLLVAVSSNSPSAASSPFRSKMATKEIVENYESVEPLIIAVVDGTLPYPTEMVIGVPTSSEDYTLNLIKNEILLPSNFKSMYFDQEGNEVVDETHYENCYYQGSVADHPDWTVTMSICQGLQGSFGDMNDRENFFHLESIDNENTAVEQPHAFYLDTEYDTPQGKCGIEGHDTILPSRENAKITSGSPTFATTIRYVEWVILSDSSQYFANGGSITATVQRAMNVANLVDTIFSQLDIRVIVVQTITFSNGNLFPVVSVPLDLLNNFAGYITATLNSNDYDSSMLLTGIDLDFNIIGIAYVGTMCDSLHTFGLTQDGGRALDSVGSTAAHELGHIFNMLHDDDVPGRTCICPDPSGNACVMESIISIIPPTFWSDCSVSDLSQLDDDECLFNVPPNNTPVIEFELPLYEVLEDIGLDHFALRVCFYISELEIERTITVITRSGTAQGGVDYIEVREEIFLRFSYEHECVAIIILEDDVPEPDEYFDVVIEEFDVSTKVNILNDDEDNDISFRYIEDSPAVNATSVYYNITFGGGVAQAFCSVVIRRNQLDEQDCSSGVVHFTTLPTVIIQYTPRVRVLRRGDGFEVDTVDRDRNFRLGVRGRCSVHLINDGVTTSINADGSVTAVIEWGLSAPSDVDPLIVSFTCFLNGGSPIPNCMSPYTVLLPPGPHSLTVVTVECLQNLPRTFNFQAP